MTKTRITLIILAFFCIFAGLAAIRAVKTPISSPDAKPIAAPTGNGLTIKRSDGLFPIEHFTLENGLHIVVLPNHRIPVITHMVWYKVGAADEPRGKSGIAHFLEHLMFKGSDTIPAGDYSKRVRALAGEDNAFTSWDYTAYYVSIAKDQLENIMTMEADRMRHLNPPPEHFASEHDVIIEERRQRTDNNPRNKFWDQVNAALFTHHPYGTPILGWPKEMESLTWQDAKAMYDVWYAPNNAIVVISGDVTAETVLPLAQKIYGGLKPETIPARDRTTVPALPAETHLTFRHSDIHEPMFVRTYRVPGFIESKADSYALDVLQEALAGNATTLFYRSLVVEQKLATNVAFSYDSGALNNGSLWITATPAPDVSIEKIEHAIDDLIDQVMQSPLPTTDIQAAITRLQDNAIYARDSVMGPAMVVGQILTTGGSLDDIQQWSSNIEKVTAEQVHMTAKKYLKRNNSHPYGQAVTGALLPADADAKSAHLSPSEEKK